MEMGERVRSRCTALGVTRVQLEEITGLAPGTLPVAAPEPVPTPHDPPRSPTDPEPGSYGAYLRERRKSLHVTQRQLASLAGLSRSSVRRSERSLHDPTERTRTALDAALERLEATARG